MLPDLRRRLKSCRGVLVDSNILLDIATKDPVWAEWSAEALAELVEHTTVLINPVIYAEASIGFSTIEALDAALPSALYRRAPLPWAAAFLAGKCFVRYRRRGGLRRSPLPDFYIGSHAAVDRLGLLTRDDTRYRSYFPGIEIFAPPAGSRRG